jgi:heat shock protein HtpX
LKKISVLARKVPNGRAEMFPGAAHVFIVNPLSGRGVDNMFSTHPNPDNRIAELEALAREMGITGYGNLGDVIEERPASGDNGDVWIAGRRYNQKSRGPWTS